MEQKYSKLAKNTAIFAVGSFASKVFSFLIVPLYTYILSTEEYGQIDIFLTTINFLVPLISLQIQESMIRFLLGKEINEKTTVSNCLLVYMISIPVAIVSSIIYKQVYNDMVLGIFFGLLVLTYSFNNIFAHYLRAIQKNVAFTIKGIIETISILSLNVIFLVLLRQGVRGYLLSMLVAQLIGIIFLVFAGELIGKLSFKNRDKAVLKQMLLYSIPLIPNALMWWVMSAGDKYIINWVMGDSANGLYSLALKIPTVVSLLYAIFFQAWEMSAIEENNSDAKKIFYENVYCVTNAMLLLLSALITMMVNPLFHIMDRKFMPSWMYVPMLTLATAFNCQSSFFGVVYTTTKKTKNAFFTTALGAFVNLLVNFALIHSMGLHGVTIGTCAGYIVVSIVRGRDIKKEIGMSFDLRRTLVSVVIIIIQIIITVTTNYIGMFCSGAIALGALCLIYKTEVTKMALLVKSVCKKRRK